MSIRGVTQLRTLRLVYCDHTGSSKGALEYVRNGGFAAFVSRIGAAQAACTTEVRRGGDPHVVATYANGKSKTVGLKNASAETAERQLEWLRTEKGTEGGSKPMKHRYFTKSPSVQGKWTPFTFGGGVAYLDQPETSS